jgi:glycosyltransferase involved in cell wall biosynthesis
MQSLKILISHTSIYKKAGWGRIFPLAVGLKKLGNDVTIITTNPKISFRTKKLNIDGVRVIIFPEIIPSRITRLGFGFLSLFMKVIHVVFNKYDVVHSDNGHRPLSGIPCRLHKLIHKSVYVAEWYDWYGKGGQYDTKKRIFKLFLGAYELKYEIKDKVIADGVVVLSEILRKRAETIKCSDRVVKIQGGADVFRLPYLFDNTELKIKYKIDTDTLTFGYINSNSYNIGEFLPLIEAISKLDPATKIKVLVFGESESIRKQLPAEILEKMIFMGWVDYSKDYEKLQLVDIFFLFKEESKGNKAGWPNCTGDYLACGRPILLNPVGEIVEFAEKYPFAIIKTTKDAQDISDKINYIINNKISIQQLGPQIRELAESVVSWECKSKELLDFYWHLRNIKKH